MIPANASPVHIVVLMAVAEDVLPPQVYQVRSGIENIFLNSIDWEDYPVICLVSLSRIVNLELNTIPSARSKLQTLHMFFFLLAQLVHAAFMLTIYSKSS